MFWMLYAFFWVILRRLNFIWRRFGTLCLLHLYTVPPIKMKKGVPKRRHIKFRHRGFTQKKAYNTEYLQFTTIGWSKSLCAPDDYIAVKLMIWRWPSQNTFGMGTVLYWTRSSRTQFGGSINVWRLAGDALNITRNFLYCNHQVHSGPGSSVGIATGYGLDGPGIESQWRRDFPHLSRAPLEPTQPPVQWVPGLSWGKMRPGRDADPSPPSSAVVQERVGLYLYSPCAPYGLYITSVPVQVCTLPLPLPLGAQILFDHPVYKHSQ